MVDLVTEPSAPSGLAAPLLRALAVSKTYRTPDHIGRLVLERIDFVLREGEIVAILGKSGSGKSTFLRTLSGLVAPSEGRVEYRGGPVISPVQGVAMVFQSFALFPWLTVLGNVELGLEAQGVSAAERRRRAVDVEVAALAASVAGTPEAMITLTLRATRSAAKAGRRSYSPSLQR
jgi:ABC-type nitrate/sulfonate/bicarbonate transport system ATPase subunit